MKEDFSMFFITCFYDVKLVKISGLRKKKGQFIAS